MTEPEQKRTIAFFDGQNLFNSAKEAFGYPYPNFDPKKLASAVCMKNGWMLNEIRFYTGIPDNTVDAARHHFWSAKLAVMGTRGITSYTRTLRYQNKRINLADGSVTTALIGREKGIDVRIALDIVLLAMNNAYDIALIFSQDQDLTEAVNEVRAIAKRDDRWIKCACAYPVSPTSQNKRGINGTDWIRLSREDYDACLDPLDYRMTK